MVSLLGGLVFASVLCFIMGLRFGRPRRATLKSRLRGEEEKPVVVSEPEKTETTRKTWGLRRLEDDARKAGLNIKGSHFVMAAILTALAAFVAALTLVNDARVAIAASLLGLFAPRWLLNYRKRHRAAAFVRRLDAALEVAVSALRAGSSLAQALCQVAEAGIEPVSEEFASVDKAVKLGMTPVDGIERLRNRIESPELDLLIVGTQILARTGGNLAEIYESIAQTVRERRALHESVRAHTAQARMSAMVVSLLPVGMTVLVRTINPGYFAPMLRSSGGKVVFGLCFVVIGIGWGVINRIVSVEVG